MVKDILNTAVGFLALRYGVIYVIELVVYSTNRIFRRRQMTTLERELLRALNDLTSVIQCAQCTDEWEIEIEQALDAIESATGSRSC